MSLIWSKKSLINGRKMCFPRFSTVLLSHLFGLIKPFFFFFQKIIGLQKGILFCNPNLLPSAMILPQNKCFGNPFFQNFFQFFRLQKRIRFCNFRNDSHLSNLLLREKGGTRPCYYWEGTWEKASS